MSNWSNFHCHSIFSDGQGTPEDIVKKAIELKMPAIGISEHCPVPFKTAWNLKAEKVDTYLELLQNLKKTYSGQIEVYSGMEVDYISDMHDEIVKKSKINKLDFTIGSIHFLGFLATGQPWNIDGTGELFKQGMKEIFKNNGVRLVESYYADLVDMVKLLNPTIIGHIDKIRLHNINDNYFDVRSDYYRIAALSALDAIKKSDSIIEINTRGLYKHLKKEPYPSLWMAKEMRQRGIRVVLSSDSHVPEDLTRGFDIAIEFLKEVGYRSRYTLKNGKWIEVTV
jgi:histidinol-phosphatase (PHP family)